MKSNQILIHNSSSEFTCDLITGQSIIDFIQQKQFENYCFYWINSMVKSHFIGNLMHSLRNIGYHKMTQPKKKIHSGFSKINVTTAKPKFQINMISVRDHWPYAFACPYFWFYRITFGNVYFSRCSHFRL